MVRLEKKTWDKPWKLKGTESGKKSCKVFGLLYDEWVGEECVVKN